MKPAWIKALVALLVFAVLYGAAQLLLFLDRAADGKVGID